MIVHKSVQAFAIAVTISSLSATPRAPPSAADAFSPFLQQSYLQQRQRQQRRIQHRLHDTDDSFLDVEFEKVKPPNNDEAASTDLNRVDSTSFQTSYSSSNSSKSLLELSLDMDPQWKLARIPFSRDDEYIDCNVAFTVDLDGTTYGIGVPCDAAVAIVLEDDKGKVTYMNPALEEHEELVEIMATQLQELLGDDVFLKKTPKILTISGNLAKYTNHWKDELFNETVSTEELMDDSDEDLDFFYNFMKSELGQEEFQKTLEECRQDTAQPVDEALLELFNVPGLGDQQDDVAGLEKMLQEMTNVDISEKESFTRLGQDLEHEGVGLKLIGFNFVRNRKSYSLVKLLKPFCIVGKYVDNGEIDDLRFDLLTPEEEKLVIPRLEQICQADLEQSGLSFQQ